MRLILRLLSPSHGFFPEKFALVRLPYGVLGVIAATRWESHRLAKQPGFSGLLLFLAAPVREDAAWVLHLILRPPNGLGKVLLSHLEIVLLGDRCAIAKPSADDMQGKLCG